MFVCSFISSSNTLIPQIQMQTDYKNNNTAINDNEHILILMVWSSSCASHVERRVRTLIRFNAKVMIRCNNQSRWSMHKLLYYSTQQSTIQHFAARADTLVVLLFKRTIFIVLKIPQYNFQLTTCTNMDSIQCTSYQDDMQQSKSMHFDTIQQSTIHFAALPS